MIGPEQETDSPSQDNPGAPNSRDSLTSIVSGLSWSTGAQIANVLLFLGLTPFLLTRLGAGRYGLFALVNSFVGLVSNIDGGLGTSASRYFSVHVGSSDREASSRLLFTVSCLMTVVVGVVVLALSLVAPVITPHLHAPRSLAASALLLVRAFMILLLVASLRGVAQSLIGAHRRWAFLTITGLVSQTSYVAAAALLVAGGYGLVGLIWATALREGLLLVFTVLGVRKMVGIGSMRLMKWSELKEFLFYSFRVQVAAIAALVNFELDAVIVGAFLPVRYVAYYVVGANFALQLRSLPLNAMGPIAVNLSRTFGRGGYRASLDEFIVFQRLWVRTSAAFALLGASSAYFALGRWLGPADRLAGVVAAVLLIGHSVNMLTGVLSSFTNSVSRPDLEARYGIVGMIVNVGLTVPLTLVLGVLGVAAGTAIGEIVGSIYFLRIAHRRLDPDIRSFFADIPLTWVLASVALTLLLEIPAYSIAPRGILGLLVCAVPAALGLVLYCTGIGIFRDSGAMIRELRMGSAARVAFMHSRERAE